MRCVAKKVILQFAYCLALWLVRTELLLRGDVTCSEWSLLEREKASAVATANAITGEVSKNFILIAYA